MVSFPAEFPFKRRSTEAEEVIAAPPPPEVQTHEEPEIEPVIQAAIEPSPEPIAPPGASVARLAPRASMPVLKPTERRKVRRDAMTTAALIRVDGNHGPPFKVTLTDISIAGARFRSARPFDTDDRGQIRLEVGPVRWTTRLRVVHCAQDADGLNTVGCAFLRTELLRPWPLPAAQRDR
jgi:hypothetical protein